MGRGVQDDGGHHAPRRAKLRFARADSSGCAGTGPSRAIVRPFASCDTMGRVAFAPIELPRLRRRYGRGRWRKRKGTAQVELAGGVIRVVRPLV
jgi:hypothetical protein